MTNQMEFCYEAKPKANKELLLSTAHAAEEACENSVETLGPGIQA